jgi:sugar transferase (PEP-CTERM/EpsH1 system associated)
LTSLATSERVNVCYFITELDVGGAQTALLRLLAGLDRDRFLPTVVCLYNGDATIAQQIHALGIPVTDLGMAAKWRWDAFWRLYRLLRRDRPTILHTWMFHANIPGRVLGRLAGVPIVISSERTIGQERRWRYWLNRATAPLADRVICVAGGVADFAAQTIGISPDKLVVIHNGIPLGGFQPGDRIAARASLGISPSACVVGTVGRLHPVKGTSYLLQAFADLAPGHAEAILLLVGDGPQRAQLEGLARCLENPERVQFLGNRSDVPRLLQAMDVFVLASVWEGMPNVALEAMAVGLPVVATGVGGTPEAVVDGETGLLVPPRDPGGLARAITRLLRDPELRRKMGQAGRRWVEQHFSVERMVRQTERLYEELLSGATR